MTGEVKMTRCPLLYGRNTKLKKEKRAKKEKRVATLEEKKIVRWAIDDKEDWEREKEVEACYESPKKGIVSHAFKHLIQNLKMYNGVKI